MQRPRLIPTIQRLERIAGGRLEEAIGTGRLTSPLLRVDGALGLTRRALDTARGVAVHGLYLPTWPDVRRLTAAVSRLEAEVRELSARVEERAAEATDEGV